MKKHAKPVSPIGLLIRNFFITFGFTAITIVLVIWFLTACRVKTLVVENNDAVLEPTILDAANVKSGRHLYAISEAKIEHAVTQKTPYVKSITLKRELPSTLRILVEEYDLSYYIEYESRHYLVTSELLVLEETTVDDAKAKGAVPLYLPKIKDPKTSKDEPDAPKLLTPMQTLAFDDKEALSWSLSLLSDIKKADFFDDIDAVDISDPFGLRLEVAGKYTVLLGNEKDFSAKLSRAENAIAYLSESMYGLKGVLHAQKDGPVTFEFTGTIE